MDVPGDGRADSEPGVHVSIAEGNAFVEVGELIPEKAAASFDRIACIALGDPASP